MIRSITNPRCPGQSSLGNFPGFEKGLLVKRIMVALMIAWGAMLSCRVSAQSLTEQLLSDDAETLVEQARQNGNIVRGAILFHQGNINCAQCHRPANEGDRIGPDLESLPPEVTASDLIVSILQPSAQIREGYETTRILTVDGQTRFGLVVDEDANSVTLRDATQVDLLHTVPRDEIELIRPGEKSSMPDDLVDQLANRQQFLDLVRYVIELREGTASLGSAVTDAVPERTLARSLEGLVAIRELNCAACHDDAVLPSGLASKQAPRLTTSLHRMEPAWIERYLRDPHGTRPNTTMPDLLAQFDDPVREDAATALTHFLLSRGTGESRFEPIQSDAVGRGNRHFHSLGCVACHAPRDAQALEQTVADAQPLGDLSDKYTVPGLTEFLLDPLASRPSGHMPNMVLDYREANDLAHFLLQASQHEPRERIVDSRLAEQGAAWALRLQCHQCHTDLLVDAKQIADGDRTGGADEDSATPSFAKLRETLRSGAAFETGCLSIATGAWPSFALSPDDRDRIMAAIGEIPATLTDVEQLDVNLVAFNCVACHDRDHLGGVADDRNPHFKTTHPNLGEQGRIPPTLSGVGGKLRPEWLRDVLVNAGRARPYMETRMPQFGEANVAPLIELLVRLDPAPEAFRVEPGDAEAEKKQGHMLAGNEGLNCVACHTYQYKDSDTMPAVDLTEMAKRLRGDWFRAYMLDPQRFSPGTVMPSFWPEGRSLRSDLAGSADEQVEALWRYLLEGRQAPMPRGVVAERLEIVVDDEVRMLRRSYPGVGKRGIGVGYPGGLNLVFDAEQLRLGLLWQGGFVDPGGVWTGQGSGNARPLGRAIELAKGPELDWEANPWVVDEGRPPDHQFRGYVLDERRRPTFRYSFGDVQVEDTFTVELRHDGGEALIGLRREVVISSDASLSRLRFRIAEGAQLERNESGLYWLSDRVRIRVADDIGAVVSAENEGLQRLAIPVTLQAGEPVVLEIMYLFPVEK